MLFVLVAFPAQIGYAHPYYENLFYLGLGGTMIALNIRKICLNLFKTTEMIKKGDDGEQELGSMSFRLVTL